MARNSGPARVRTRLACISLRLSRSVKLSLALLFASLFAGCLTKREYRIQADHESYALMEEKTQDPQWWTPPVCIEPPPQSRNFDPFDPECGPLPPDDLAAHKVMQFPGRQVGSKHWREHGMAETIENDSWQAYLELDEDEELQLSSQSAVELGLLNSREYQFEIENLYLSALVLSLEKFQYDLQWFGRNRTFYDFFGRRLGAKSNDASVLTTSSNLGFTRQFPAGGQLLVDFANTFVWQFAGRNSGTTLSTVTINMVQPLLRGAFRDVQLEELTQAERDVLYAARDYARFRKQFYFGIVSGAGGYLSLLSQLQTIRNLEANLDSLDQNLRAHEALAAAGIVSPIQVDQVFQSFQSGQLDLIRARNNLENSLDLYKQKLGLPPELEANLDDSLLAPFELNSPEITELQQQVDELQAEFRELDEPPTAAVLEQGFERLRRLHASALKQRLAILSEWLKWSANQPADTERSPRDAEARATLKIRLDDLADDLASQGQQLEQLKEIDDADREQVWEAIQRMSRLESNSIGDLFVIQSQIRAFLLEIPGSDWLMDEPVSYALSNRLDLMNQQGKVVDQWRKAHVAADALEADLDLVGEAVVGTDPLSSNPVRFSSDDSSFRAGFRLDGPLNRQLERNIYRAQLVNYQRERRSYIERRDEIVRAVRRDLRELDADRLNFDIARQTLIVAARQVELARIELLAPNQTSDSTATLNALDALNQLLDAKNRLIGVWVSYETNRLRLLLDTEALQLDERGLPQDGDIDESASHEIIASGRSILIKGKF
jgi:outer membrane protein TolC